ncbi:hypothetical protein [Actinomadura bangladeshensis]|uniref:Uncharacterized protein n=1 Tax=Actinomadura bangladeshensis TaxID=453573 RepID=A0A6L9QT99_9ACTN|nr:hypothetical protein [Actinomadura bangladeshensis]NEA28705.1 hypothetical protein [Actinomadura bangladeshensis]
MLGADPDVAVDGSGRRVPEADDALLVAFAGDEEFAAHQVQVTAVGIVGVVADAGEFGQSPACRLEQGEEGVVAALCEGFPFAVLEELGEILVGEDRDDLFVGGWRAELRHRIGQIFVGGPPLEELLQCAVPVVA